MGYNNKQLAKDFIDYYRGDFEYAGESTVVHLNHLRTQKIIENCKKDIPQLYRKDKNIIRLNEKKLGCKNLSLLEEILAKKLNIPTKKPTKKQAEKYLGQNYLLYFGEDFFKKV
ncbi:hypothetical protein ACFLZZ_00450 [Nanoarchaeota archaeon]